MVGYVVINYIMENKEDFLAPREAVVKVYEEKDIRTIIKLLKHEAVFEDGWCAICGCGCNNNGDLLCEICELAIIDGVEFTEVKK